MRGMVLIGVMAGWAVAARAAEDPVGKVVLKASHVSSGVNVDGVLDDDEVAAVATYVRNSWDNRAGAVTPVTGGAGAARSSADADAMGARPAGGW